MILIHSVIILDFALILVAFSSQTWYCAERFCSKSFICTGFSIVETGSEQDLLAAVTDVGPIRYCTVI